MKKYLGIVCSLVLAVSLLLVPAAPVAASEIMLVAIGEEPREDRVTISAPAEMTLDALASISWEEWLIAGYAPHVDIIIDVSAISGVPGDTDALVVEYAYNNSSAIADGHSATDTEAYGCQTGAWYPTFDDDGAGDEAVTVASNAWLSSGLSGGTPIADGIGYSAITENDFVFGTLDNWVAGTEVTEINGNTLILRFEFEVDSWIKDTNAKIRNILINGESPDLELKTIILEDVVSILLSPGSIDFGSVYPGGTAEAAFTITNTGTVAVDLKAATSATFYATYLTIDGSSVEQWGVSIPKGAPQSVALALSVPHGTPAGVKTGLLIIWVERSTTQPEV